MTKNNDGIGATKRVSRINLMPDIITAGCFTSQQSEIVTDLGAK